MFKLLILVMTIIIIVLDFINFVKYYNNNIFKQEGNNFKEKLFSLIKKKYTILLFIGFILDIALIINILVFYKWTAKILICISYLMMEFIMLFFIKDLIFIIYKKLSALSICLINQADAPNFLFLSFLY